MRCSNVCKAKKSRMVIARFCWVCREQRELRFDGYDDDMTRVRQSFSRLFIVFTCMLTLVLILTYRKTTSCNGQRRSMSKREARVQRKKEENIVSFRFTDKRHVPVRVTLINQHFVDERWIQPFDRTLFTERERKKDKDSIAIREIKMSQEAGGNRNDRPSIGSRARSINFAS